MRRLFPFPGLSLFAALLFAAGAQAAAPRLFFTDLTSGPKTGGENNKGVYLTIYGNFFGASQGASTVTIGGGEVDNCPIWGTAWLNYQKIVCELGASVSTGNVVVTVSGNASNGLPFTVRSGNIYFVATTGSDSADGSFATPWLTPLHALGTIANGDTVYIRAGSYGGTTYGADGNSSLDMQGNSGTSGSPKAMLGYPGETATIACSKPSSNCNDLHSYSGPSSYWTFGELDFGATLGGFTHYNINYDGTGGGGDGIRFIGNKMHGAYSVANVIQGPLDGFDFLGNDVFDYWSVADGAGINERGYGIYFGGYGTQQNVNVAWNRFENTQGYGRGNPNTLGSTHHSTADISGTDVTWASGDQFAAEMEGHGINFDCSGGYVVDTVTDATHLTLTTSAGTHTGCNYYSGGVSTKGLQVYGHCPHDCGGSPQDNFVNFTVSNNQFLRNCMEGAALGGTDGADGGNPPWYQSGTLGVYNNLFALNGWCQNLNDQTYPGLEIGDSLGGMDAAIYNNTFYLNAGGDIGNNPASDLYIFPDLETFTVTNNIFYAQPESVTVYTNYLYLDGGTGIGGGANGTVTGTTNCFFANSNTNISVFGQFTSTISTADPLLVDPPAITDSDDGDFHLQSGSPCKSGGTTYADTSPDMDGVPRPQNTTYAAGVFEYNTGAGGGSQKKYLPILK